MASTITVAALRQNIELEQGASVTISITAVDKNKNYITNFSGYSARAQIRQRPADPILFEWNTAVGTGIGTVNLVPSTGVGVKSTVDLVLSPAQAASLDFWLAKWDCFLTNSSNQSSCLAKGSIVLTPRVTH